MAKDTVVVIEDEADILELVQYNLSREGYEVIGISHGAEGLDHVREHPPALVLLDLMLPGMDGNEVCRELKTDPATKHVPVIMVTAKGEESDIVLGLGLGADDYVTKPFSVKELVARVRAVLRRGKLRAAQDDKQRLQRAGVTIDSSRHEVLVDQERQNFTATEFRLLHFLACHPGRVFTRDHLISRVMGENAIVIDRNIDVHVRAVRKKLGPYRTLIETIRGVGYRFADETEG